MILCRCVETLIIVAKINHGIIEISIENLGEKSRSNSSFLIVYLVSVLQMCYTQNSLRESVQKEQLHFLETEKEMRSTDE